MLRSNGFDIQSNVIALVTGLGVGVGLGVLLAPKAGRDLRNVIGRKAEAGVWAATAGAEEVQHRTAALVEKGKRVVEEQKTRVENAVAAGKAAYQAPPAS